MPSEDNKRVVKRYLEEVVSTGEVDRVSEFIASAYVEIFEGERHELGVEGAKDHVRGLRAVYPDLSITVGLQIAEGEWVATCLTARGMHKGEWMGIAPTGERVEYTGVNVNRVVDGKIVEHTGAANMLLPLLKIGAVHVVSGRH